MKKDLGIKAVVLGIALVFVFGAFTPAIGSQSVKTVSSPSSKESKNVEIDVEKSADGLILDDNQKYLDECADKEIDADTQIDTLDKSVDDTRDSKGSPMPLGTGDLWWNTNWLYRKEITINHIKIDGNQNNFPVLISLSADGDLASRALDNGSDIVFTDISRNKLNHEIELFNGINGDLIAWVNVTSLSSNTNTTLYMYYGNGAAIGQVCAEEPCGIPLT